jgi:type IV pilus assembly protein PilM
MSMIDEMEDTRQTVLCCPRCETANSPQRKFCAKCGAPLWEPCFRCGELCAADEDYCGACGVNLADSVAAEQDRMEADFRAAAEMQLACRFEEAITLLGPIAKYDHPRLAAYASRAAALIRQLTADRARRRVASQEACRIARQAFDACDYDGAAALLEEVPPPLRNGEIEDILSQIALRRREIAMESDGLREAVRENRLIDLPPRLARLLALKPDHAYARSVAGQVQKRFVAVAKKMLAEHRYDQAQQLLDQISAQADAPDFRQLHRQVAELAWLDWDLRNAPVVDDALLAVAERLRRLAPDNAHAVRLCNELQRRTRLAKGGQRRQPLPWARPPKQTSLGVPVEWLTGFRRVTCAEALESSELLRRPGRFAIACGLALAGIKQAALRINLLSGKQQGVLHRVTRLMRPQSARSAWGIDLGASGLKAVKLAWNEAKQQAVIKAAVLIEHAKVLSHAANEADEGRLAMETLKAFLDCQQPKAERVCVGLPGRMTLSRQIKTPPADSSKTAKLVQFEAAHRFPFPLEQLAWGFQLFDDDLPDPNCEVEASGEKTRRAILIAAKRTTAEHFLDAFRRLDIRVDVLQTDFVALHNFLAYDYFAAPGNSASGEACPVVAALDIGCDVTNVVVSSPHSLWFRSCGVAGHSFTRALVKEFNLSVAQAEQQKRAPESTERFSDLYEALSPVFDDLLKEVQQSLSAYAETQPDRPVQRVLGLGGGVALHGLLRCLRCGR